MTSKKAQTNCANLETCVLPHPSLVGEALYNNEYSNEMYLIGWYVPKKHAASYEKSHDSLNGDGARICYIVDYPIVGA